MRGLTVLAMGAVLLGGSAQAASFDCTRAKSLRERAVCANPALSAADEAMARGYAAAQAAASEAAAAVMALVRDGFGEADRGDG